ncbi:MAG: DUF4386 domain-containing protein [Saprospiraceae bacterium]|nr:DUF4386 domain-containing protein [Saprospiraceae bacterium]
MSTLKSLSNRQIALATGISIVLMAVLAGMVMGMVHTPLIVPENPSLTYGNLISQTTTFRMGILGWTGILITDIIAAWGLYLYFKPRNNSLSLLAGWFRLAYAAILGFAIVQLIIVVLLTQTGTGWLENPGEKEFLTMLFLNGFQSTWSFGLIIFGLHLLILGWLVWSDKLILKILSVLILISAVGYLLTNTLNILMPDYETIKPTLETVFMLPMVLGEVGLAIWLIIKGGK